MTPAPPSPSTPFGLYHVPAARRPIIRQILGKALLSVNVGDSRDIDEVLREIGTTLSFPIWYGNNFDALHDCLTDPDWRPTKRIAIELAGLEKLRQQDPEALSTLVDVLQSAVDLRASSKAPLLILLTTPVRGIPNLPEA